MKKSLLLLVLLILGVTSFASANLITNGDFETGNLNGWNQTDVTVVNFNDGYYNHVAKLNNTNWDGLASLAQTFYISPGTTSLNVSFDFLFTGTDDAKLLDDVVNSSLTYKIDDTGYLFNDWTLVPLGTLLSSTGLMVNVANFQATIDLSDLYDSNPNGALSFTLLESTGLWWDNTDTTLYIDNVDVAPVPEPATLLLLGSGLAGLAFYRRKRK